MRRPTPASATPFAMRTPVTTSTPLPIAPRPSGTPTDDGPSGPPLYLPALLAFGADGEAGARAAASPRGARGAMLAGR